MEVKFSESFQVSGFWTLHRVNVYTYAHAHAASGGPEGGRGLRKRQEANLHFVPGK